MTNQPLTDEIIAELMWAGCRWPVEPCPCTPETCPVSLGAGDRQARPLPPYGTPERAVADWSDGAR